MGWLDNMILRTKLLLLTGVMIISLLIVGVISFNAVSMWGEDVKTLGSEKIPAALAVGIMRNGINQVAIQQNRVRGLDNDPKYMEKSADAHAAMLKGLEGIERGLKEFDAIPRDKEQEEIYQQYKKDLTTWTGETANFIRAVDMLSKTSNKAEAEKIFISFTEMIEKIRPHRVALTAAIDKTFAKVRSVSDESVKHASENAAKFKQTTIVVVAVSLALSILLSILIIRSVTLSITKAVTTINDGALQISSASDQVASSSTSLAQGASEQASSVEEVSATLEQATAGVTSNTENARQADILAKASTQAAKDGLSKGEELVVSMREVTESASKIANIVKTIDQIAFQVNLLALNAAVEAARAGEHGLGFAVVADEVRNLAQRAANSAKETGTVIEEAVTQIKKGSEIASLASNSFREIEDKAKKVSDLIGEVAMSSREQAEGLNQLGMAMSQIDQITQQVAANSEEAAAASEELNAQAAAAIEAVAALAKIVGIDVNQNVSHQKMSSPHKMELKKDVKHIAFTPKHAAAKQTPRANKNTDEIFPLDERDLKEF